jgi:hypothetical protein
VMLKLLNKLLQVCSDITIDSDCTVIDIAGALLVMVLEGTVIGLLMIVRRKTAQLGVPQSTAL